MNWFDFIRYIIVPISVAIIGWQLWSGKALSRGWSVVALRSEKPVRYWLNIAIQCVAVVAILVLVGRMGL
jgi:hypothetical protein